MSLAAGNNRSFGFVWQWYQAITHFFGDRQRFLRRASALCLVFIGVHTGADLVDDTVFSFIDVFDDGMDGLAFRLSDWLGSWSYFSEESMRARALFWAERLGPEEKENLSLVLALLTELLVDLMLFDFLWATQIPDAKKTVPYQRKRITKLLVEEIRFALHPIDLKRISVISAIFFLCLSGAVIAGQEIERLVFTFWSQHYPDWWADRFSAASGLLFALVLLWRMLPGILLGAFYRQLIKTDERSGKVVDESSPHHIPHKRLFRRFYSHCRRFWRGAFMTLVLLGLATAGLVGNGLWPLVLRLWGSW